jgi:hypothetical protein
MKGVTRVYPFKWYSDRLIGFEYYLPISTRPEKCLSFQSFSGNWSFQDWIPMRNRLIEKDPGEITEISKRKLFRRLFKESFWKTY